VLVGQLRQNVGVDLALTKDGFGIDPSPERSAKSRHPFILDPSLAAGYGPDQTMCPELPSPYAPDFVSFLVLRAISGFRGAAVGQSSLPTILYQKLGFAELTRNKLWKACPISPMAVLAPGASNRDRPRRWGAR